jgi:hypothetical protein
MLLTQEHFNAALFRQHHAKLMKGCTLEELVSIKVPTSTRDPLFTKQPEKCTVIEYGHLASDEQAKCRLI